MSKKKLSIGILSLIGVIFIFFIKQKENSTTVKSCVFCNPDVLARQTFYEDDLVMALYTHKPIFPGHCLIIPKRCVNRFEELSDQEVMQIGQVIRKVNVAVEKVFKTSSYLILQKNGVEVGQTEPHIHFHYIPRKEGNTSTIEFMARMIILSAMGPISSEEIQEVISKMKEAM